MSDENNERCVPAEVTIDGVTYRRADPPTGPVRIVVMDRGWVHVGRWSRDGDECRLDNAYTVRRWGTTRGLGQIAAEGPTTSTVLDPAGTVRYHVGSAVLSIDCDESRWPSCQ